MNSADILLIPGGFGTESWCRTLAYSSGYRKLHANTRWTTSVCTGSLVLGAAGILQGFKATSHWMVLDQLASFGATPVSDRVVAEGKVITAAGVSSGIDMALHLAAREAGDDVAKPSSSASSTTRSRRSTAARRRKHRRML